MEVEMLIDPSLDLVARATALLLLAFGAALLLRRASAGLRRQLWAGCFVTLALLPLFSLGLPRVRMTVLPATPAPLPPPPIDHDRWFWADRVKPAAPAPAGTPSASANPTALEALGLSGDRFDLDPGDTVLGALIGLYLAGLAVHLVRVGRARRRADRLLDHATPVDSAWARPAGLDVRETDQVELPLTVGSFRPVVLVPRAGRLWTPAWQRAVLAHEAAHVRSGDPLLQLLAELVSALYWFHPLVRLAARQLRTERELAADDAALASGMRPSEYANLLFELACLPETPPVQGAVVPLLTPSGLKARVLGVLDGGRSRLTPRALSLALGLTGALAFGPLALALPARPAEQSPPLGTGGVIGRAVDEAGRGVAGAEVRFRTFWDPPLSVAVRTDAQGWFRYPWTAEPLTEFALYIRAGETAARRAILNIPYGTTLPVTMSLRRAPSISGIVRGPDGAPVAGAEVRIWQDDRTSFGPGRGVVVRSDASGSWRLPAMLYGRYVLLVTGPGGVMVSQPLKVDASDLSNVETNLPAAQPISGFLRDEEGRPLAGVHIDQNTHFVALSGNRVNRSAPPEPQRRHLDYDVSAADGSFRLVPRGIPGSPLQAARADGTVLFGTYFDGSAEPHWSVRRTPVNVVLTPGVHIRGLVRTPQGRPVPHAEVGAIGRSLLTDPVTADADGAFSLWAPRERVDLRALSARPAHPRSPRASGLRTLLLQNGPPPRDVEIVVSP